MMGRDEMQKLALAYLGAPTIVDVRLDNVIAAHIDRVLGATDGNLSLAAVLLGLHRRSLQRMQRRRERPTKRKRRVSRAKRAPRKRRKFAGF